MPRPVVSCHNSLFKIVFFTILEHKKQTENQNLKYRIAIKHQRSCVSWKHRDVKLLENNVSTENVTMGLELLNIFLAFWSISLEMKISSSTLRLLFLFLWPNSGEEYSKHRKQQQWRCATELKKPWNGKQQEFWSNGPENVYLTSHCCVICLLFICQQTAFQYEVFPLSHVINLRSSLSK